MPGSDEKNNILINYMLSASECIRYDILPSKINPARWVFTKNNIIMKLFTQPRRSFIHLY